ncbi:hypothetical protein Tco_1357027, partial [Tanacetum coccineum]
KVAKSKYLAQHEEEEWNDPIFYEKGSPGYIDATLKQELESMECQVESLMWNKVLLEYEEDQVMKLEEDMRKTKDTFMCLADSLIATLKVEIEAQRVHSTKIEKITRFPTHTPTVTSETLKPIMVHRLEYEDEVEIKMMGTEMDKESLEHNLYENDITSDIFHNFSPTSNTPIKPKDSGSFRMNVVEPLAIHTPPSAHVAYFHQNGVYRYYHPHLILSVGETHLLRIK